jgi:hypothetical protein
VNESFFWASIKSDSGGLFSLLRKMCYNIPSLLELLKAPKALDKSRRQVKKYYFSIRNLYDDEKAGYFWTLHFCTIYHFNFIS